MDLHFVLEELGGRGIKGLLVEGGGETATRFVGRGLADKMTLFYAPKLLGAEGVPMIGALRATKVAESLQFSVSEVERVGRGRRRDALSRCRRRGGTCSPGLLRR